MKQSYTKNAVIDRALTTAHKRAVVFYKLSKHKVDNGNLPGKHSDYLVAIAKHYAKTIKILEKAREQRNERKRDKKGQFITSGGVLKWENRFFHRATYDAELREIIKKVSESCIIKNK